MRTGELGRTRRGFLALGIGAVATGCGARVLPQAAPAPSSASLSGAPPSSNGARRHSVIVVGAGLSGLACALWLADANYDVRVLEATARPGGRILTIRSPFAEGQYVEAGAAHVVNDPTLLALCERVGVRVEQRAPSPRGRSRVVLRGGRRVVVAANQRAARRIPLSDADDQLGQQGRMDKYFAEAGSFDPSLPVPSRLFSLDSISGAQFLRERGACAGFVAEMDDMLGLGENGIEGMSALGMVQIWAEILREIKLGGNGRVLGGCDALPNALAARLGERVLYDAELSALEHSARGVRALARVRGELRHFSAERVIFAIPAPLLLRVALTPALPPDKQRALSELCLENVTRAWAQTSSRAWAERAEDGRVESDSALGPVRDESEGMPGNAGILGLYVRRAEARRLAELTDDARQQALLDYVEQAEPGTRSSLLAFASKCWSSDPFQRGAYAYFKVGQMTTLPPVLARAEGRLHFAGDHTSHRPGFMHGALSAAARVVQEITLADQRVAATAS